MSSLEPATQTPEVGVGYTGARGAFQHPAAAAHWKTFQSGSADVPIIAGREVIVERSIPVKDGLSMDMVKEGG